MSLLAQLANVALVDPTVHAALMKFREDPELNEFDTLVALVTVMAGEKQQLFAALKKMTDTCTCQPKISTKGTP